MTKSKPESERASTRAPRSRGRGLTVTRQRIPSRMAKRRLGERLKNDTASFNQGNLADKFRKEGYDELRWMNSKIGSRKCRAPWPPSF